MIVWAIDAKSEMDLANRIASYLRRGYKIGQIIFAFGERNPYKAFLIKPDNINIDENLKEVSVIDDFIGKNIYEIDCIIPKEKENLLKAILYGNSEKLITINNKEIFFDNVLIVNNKIILKNPYDNKTKKIVKLKLKDLKKELCYLIKEL